MIWKGKYQAGRWFLLLRFLTLAQRKEVRQFSVLQNENVIYMILRIIREKKTVIITKCLRSARHALSKITIAPTHFLGIYELILFLKVQKNR